jgi:hypothetical protein
LPVRRLVLPFSPVKLHVIHDGATIKVWSLREGAYTLGQSPSADLRLGG